jgi:hypothetical protein
MATVAFLVLGNVFVIVGLPVELAILCVHIFRFSAETHSAIFSRICLFNSAGTFSCSLLVDVHGLHSRCMRQWLCVSCERASPRTHLRLMA